MRKLCLTCYLLLDEQVEICPTDNTTPVALNDDESGPFGEEVGGYEVLEKIASGRISVLYNACAVSDRQEVAMKILRRSLSDNDTAIERFKQESRMLCRLESPHIARILDAAQIDRCSFIVLEHIDSVSLQDMIEAAGRFPYQKAVPLFHQLAEALDHCHDAGIVLRGLHPDNIMIDSAHQVRLIDFSLAVWMPRADESNFLHSPGILCDPVYCSPEECEGKTLEPSRDIYGLGLILFESLTGKAPFREGTVQEICIQQISNDPPSFADIDPNLEIPRRLEEITRKLLQKNGADRYATLKEFLIDLDDFDPDLKPEIRRRDNDDESGAGAKVMKKLIGWKNRLLGK